MLRAIGLLAFTVACAFTLVTLSNAQQTQTYTKSVETKGDIDSFFDHLDKNKDGKLTKSEFIVLADSSGEKDKARQQLGTAFDNIDPSNRGITKDQFKRYLDAQKKKAAK